MHPRVSARSSEMIIAFARTLLFTNQQLSTYETELMFLVNAFHSNLMIGINLHPARWGVNT